MPLSLNQKLEHRGVGNMSVEIEGLKNQIGRLETLRVSTCLKSHSFKKYTNEQLETIIEDLKDVLIGLENFNSRFDVKQSNGINSLKEQIFFEAILDQLCKFKKRDIFVVLPKKEDERVPYLKKEIFLVILMEVIKYHKNK